MSRRRLLRVAGIGIGATVAGTAGLYALGSRKPAGGPAVPVDFHESKGDASTMNDRVLVAYASEHGSTAGVAKAIGEELAARGKSVDVLLVANVTSLAGYQAVVFGSAIHSGHPLPEALRFLEKHQDALRRVPVVVFCVHSFLLGNSPREKELRHAYFDDVRKVVTPQQEAWFAGKLDPERFSYVERLAMRWFGHATFGDLRDWDAIRAWARQIL